MTVTVDENEDGGADRRQKVQSVEVGMRLLIQLSRLGATASLSQIAKASAMPPSKAHRYVRALIETGLVAQDDETGLYRLGPEALAIGFAAMGNIDVVSMSGRVLADLRDSIDETCMLCVWGNLGPAVVRIEPAARAVAINVRLGSVMPVLRSAAGLVYAAFLDDRQIREMMSRERDELRARAEDTVLALAESSIVETRRSGLATVHSTLTPGVAALAVPVFDYQGHVAATIVSLGPESHFDAAESGAIARELRGAAQALSRALGHKASA